MKKEIKELKGANMDIDLIHNPNLSWEQDECPWNKIENTNEHKCAIKGTSLCKYFRGIKYPDKVLCSFNKKGIKK